MNDQMSNMVPVHLWLCQEDHGRLKYMIPQFRPPVHCWNPNCGYNTPIGIDSRRALDLLEIHKDIAHSSQERPQGPAAPTPVECQTYGCWFVMSPGAPNLEIILESLKRHVRMAHSIVQDLLQKAEALAPGLKRDLQALPEPKRKQELQESCRLWDSQEILGELEELLTPQGQ